LGCLRFEVCGWVEMIGGESDTLDSVSVLESLIASLSLSLSLSMNEIYWIWGRERMKGKDIGRVGVLDR
jgi:hypothetical protein